MTPIIGSRRAWASALPAATPTRRPVNIPGPRSTAMAPMSAELDAGLAAEELDGRGERLGVAAAPRGVDRAEDALVAADGAADLGGGGGDAEDQHQADPATGLSTPARASERGAHAGPDRAEGHVAVVVAGAEGEPHLEVVVRQHGEDGVAPLDEHHAALVEHLGQAEVEGLAQLLEAVHVEVVHREAALVHVDEREGGAGDAVRARRGPGRSPARRRSCRRRGRRPARSRRRVGPATTPRCARSRVRVDGGGGGDHGHVGGAYERPYRRSTRAPSAHTTS